MLNRLLGLGAAVVAPAAIGFQGAATPLDVDNRRKALGLGGLALAWFGSRFAGRAARDAGVAMLGAYGYATALMPTAGIGTRGVGTLWEGIKMDFNLDGVLS